MENINFDAPRIVFVTFDSIVRDNRLEASQELNLDPVLASQFLAPSLYGL